MNIERDELERVLDNVTFMYLENKKFLKFSTLEIEYATLDSISLKSDNVVTVSFKNDMNFLEFAFDDFEFDGTWVRFFNGDTKLSLKVKVK